MVTNQDETVIDGLANYVELSRDKRDAQLGSAIYKSVAGVFCSNITPGSSCSLAFPSMIIRPDIRTECFVAVLDSSVIVAWTKGLIRKTPQSAVLPRKQIKSADIEPYGSGATVLKITAGDQTVTIAMPNGRSDIGNAITQAILPASPASA
jgi:hypothetical protein